MYVYVRSVHDENIRKRVLYLLFRVFCFKAYNMDRRKQRHKCSLFVFGSFLMIGLGDIIEGYQKVSEKSVKLYPPCDTDIIFNFWKIFDSILRPFICRIPEMKGWVSVKCYLLFVLTQFTKGPSEARLFLSLFI